MLEVFSVEMAVLVATCLQASSLRSYRIGSELRALFRSRAGLWDLKRPSLDGPLVYSKNSFLPMSTLIPSRRYSRQRGKMARPQNTLRIRHSNSVRFSPDRRHSERFECSVPWFSRWRSRSLLAAAGRSNDDPRNHESPGCKGVGDSPIAHFFTAG